MAVGKGVEVGYEVGVGYGSLVGAAICVGRGALVGVVFGLSTVGSLVANGRLVGDTRDELTLVG